MLARKSSLRLIQRVRNEIDGFVPENCPDIPENLHFDREKNLFLLYESGVLEEGRFSIWSHKFKRDHMIRDFVILVDGSFKMGPSGYYQMVTFHANIFNRFYLPTLLYTFNK